MMTKEEMLKSFILTKYRSLREFTQEIGMPYSTMTTIIKRGIDNSNVQNIIKICQALGISTDDLAEGKIVSIEKTDDDSTKIEDLIQHFIQQLLSTDNLTLDDKPVNQMEVLQIVNALDAVVEVAKRNRRFVSYYNNLKE